MRIEDISGKDLVIEQLKPGSAAEVFKELIERIGRVRNFTDRVRSDYLSEVVKRHHEAPCGLARGLAFPNARLRDLSRPSLALGISGRGLDLGGKDGSISRIIFLYLGCAPAAHDERELLARLSRALTDPAIAERMASSDSALELWEVLRSMDRAALPAVREGGACRTR